MQHHINTGDFKKKVSPGQIISYNIPGQGQFQGTVLEVSPNGTAKIQLNNGSIQYVDVSFISSIGDPVVPGGMGGG
ncbi:hypothetical protein, partial [Priestia megaterium]|uniref:hypothetical protein n=1 Tax=Priestia megaterium TaxID=1404 RepID=UPI002E1EE1C0|nr:hypothetical protein [Priestia megaterium]